MEIKGIKYTAPFFDNCYDSKTEVLTEKGWKFFKDVTLEDKMCTLNRFQCIEYHKPTEIINEKYSGEMYRYFSSRSKIDLLVTPNHNMYVQTVSGRKSEIVHDLYVNNYGVNRLGRTAWRFEKAKDIKDKSRYFKKDANYIKDPVKHINVCGRTLLMDDWLEFLGYYLSEGSSTITKEKHYVVQLRQFGPELEKMSIAMDKVSKNKINIKHSDGRVILNDKDLCLYLKNTFGNVYNKYIPRDILNNCSKQQLHILFDALMLGDGHNLRYNYKNGEVTGGSNYHTASYRLKDDFMELCLKIGYSASSYVVKKKGTITKFYDREIKSGADNWRVCVRFNNNTCLCCEKNNFYVNKVFYTGTIHCVTVKNHTLYVRRNGKPVWSGNSGYAKASRENVLSLYKLGIPIKINPISFEKARPELGEDGEILRSLINKDVDYNINITHTTPEFWKNHKEEGVLNCGYTIWETDRLHPSWPDYINNNVDMCMVGCQWNVDIFKKSGVIVPIFNVPHVIDTVKFEGISDYNIKGLSDETFVFYSIFQWQERKNPIATIRAYWRAFMSGEDVALVLKTYRSDYSDQEKDAVRKMLINLKKMSPSRNHPKIYLIPDMLSEDEMLSLHRRGDCYVSLDRGEGFGLSTAYAGCAGNPVVSTGFGGVTEYLNEENSYLVDYILTPVAGMPWSPWYLMEQSWAEADIIHGSDLMREVYNNREDAKNKGNKLKEYLQSNFNYASIGNKIVDAINSM